MIINTKTTDEKMSYNNESIRQCGDKDVRFIVLVLSNCISKKSSRNIPPIFILHLFLHDNDFLHQRVMINTLYNFCNLIYFYPLPLYIVY